MIVLRRQWQLAVGELRILAASARKVNREKTGSTVSNALFFPYIVAVHCVMPLFGALGRFETKETSARLMRQGWVPPTSTKSQNEQRYLIKN